ncbi:hypothetical protein GW915_06210 [bacterium]|nr:hypothetical protein [bacterium]
MFSKTRHLLLLVFCAMAPLCVAAVGETVGIGPEDAEKHAVDGAAGAKDEPVESKEDLKECVSKTKWNDDFAEWMKVPNFSSARSHLESGIDAQIEAANKIERPLAACMTEEHSLAQACLQYCLNSPMKQDGRRYSSDLGNGYTLVHDYSGKDQMSYLQKDGKNLYQVGEPNSDFRSPVEVDNEVKESLGKLNFPSGPSKNRWVSANDFSAAELCRISGPLAEMQLADYRIKTGVKDLGETAASAAFKSDSINPGCLLQQAVLADLGKRDFQSSTNQGPSTAEEEAKKKEVEEAERTLAEATKIRKEAEALEEKAKKELVEKGGSLEEPGKNPIAREPISPPVFTPTVAGQYSSLSKPAAKKPSFLTYLLVGLASFGLFYFIGKALFKKN